jgi:hypothetical protein
MEHSVGTVVGAGSFSSFSTDSSFLVILDSLWFLWHVDRSLAVLDDGADQETDLACCNDYQDDGQAPCQMKGDCSCFAG